LHIGQILNESSFIVSSDDISLTIKVVLEENGFIVEYIVEAGALFMPPFLY
jgi:hypothetical protein